MLPVMTWNFAHDVSKSCKSRARAEEDDKFTPAGWAIESEK